MTDVPRDQDRRTQARLVCSWPSCPWWFESADASAMAEAWERHSHDHWDRLR